MSGPISTEEIAELVMRLGRQLGGAFEALAAELDLTAPQALLLRQLGEPMPMSAAAGKLHCDASNVTGIVDRLAARGLVERRPHPSDRRIKQLALTAAGKRMRGRLEAMAADLPGLACLTTADRSALRELLSKSLGSGPGQ
ncbi:MAG: MarR family transcriptional regulator [Candidatus Dormibacteraeota bacterium]|nr:MarR family transcriptional regulator [Candidatus Dormibacteraeota bacterium]